MMRNFNKIDPISLKAFYFTAESLNFTRAAVLANLTQSGVSQHINKLEGELGVSLFNRTQRKVELTEAGAQLREYAENYLEGLDVLLENLDRQTQSLNGPVRYGMPASCLKTPHFPILLEKRVDFLEVEINISILSNEEIFDEITEGNLDFGFVTKKSPRGGFDYIDFAKESYVLVGSPELIDDFNEETPFIDYPGMGVLLEYWRQNYFPRKRNLNEHNVFKAGSINDLDAAILMCTMGMGVSIFPLHCVDILIYEGELNAYTRKGKSDPTESIYIVSKKERTKPRRVERVIQTFLEMK